MRILSGRLKEIYDVIPYGLDVVADIGADHGKLIVAILLKNKAQRGFALDISEKSLDKAKILAEERKSNTSISARAYSKFILDYFIQARIFVEYAFFGI